MKHILLHQVNERVVDNISIVRFLFHHQKIMVLDPETGIVSMRAALLVPLFHIALLSIIIIQKIIESKCTVNLAIAFMVRRNSNQESIVRLYQNQRYLAKTFTQMI
ncbi:unnamed protein product [Meganyctiphanes norvegica]|uniref:Transmembrane protein n=1 Tax=Meganyctiphanes norvegica TaxID=48144 RepID=A0AAV2PJZ4_MEGNR